ncbi:MAG TPA: ABC transporter [Verrucomicrobiales bacterium]|nr:ABC transporter [Pedosphaera sp.]MBL6844464.1 ABC transporter ATP-binding protein [Verrucomicrobiae bacterium]RZO67335.1 MAG: ABC transporter ATP-binding protein [Limisphaerales bacterium]HAO67390.1 ABC transporter [Verrucomicrobiales bacterium]HAW02571.1 ABC transporter [Verrucomicrobiales bacterium]|tara:strand:+ start:632 stop:1495 length:864 start_codon:yes stop_codon:yes gene_type:complete
MNHRLTRVRKNGKTKPSQTTQDADPLNIKSLSVQRNGKRILRNVHWQIRKGENWVVLGSNGSGKTTMLSTLLGYFVPTRGDITLLGEQYGNCDWRQLRMKLGIVSSSLRQLMAEDEPALHAVITGKYAMIDLWGKPKQADVIEAKKILRLIECQKLANRPWAILSQGERQRILIGRALMAKPEVLILDEPCAGLDPAAREHFLQFLERMGQEQDAPTFILVTHHVEEITPMYTHALMLKSGRVIANGPMKQSLNSDNLSATFKANVKLRRRAGRYSLEIGENQGKWM